MRRYFLQAVFLVLYASATAQFEVIKTVPSLPNACDGEIHVRLTADSGPFRLDLYDENDCLLHTVEQVNQGVYIFSSTMGDCAPVGGGLCAGTYRISINGKVGCLYELTATIAQQPCKIEVELEDIKNVTYASTSSCCDDEPKCMDGSFRFTVTGYEPPVSIQVLQGGTERYRVDGWISKKLTQTLTNLSAGTYTIMVEGEEDVSCVYSRDVTVSTCNNYTAFSETNEGCTPSPRYEEPIVDAQVIHALNANDFSGAIYIKLSGNYNEQAITTYFEGPYDFVPDESAAVDKYYGTSLEHPAVRGLQPRTNIPNFFPFAPWLI